MGTTGKQVRAKKKRGCMFQMLSVDILGLGEAGRKIYFNGIDSLNEVQSHTGVENKRHLLKGAQENSNSPKSKFYSARHSTL